jgi:hypothetical protein
MARIRTIKPSFFRHETLFEAEQATRLPLRLAFVGLWTAADREGRFRWQPRALKLDCLPYDDLDFSRVLDALATRGLIVRYEVNGTEYGYIPSWQKHQIINNREMASTFPEPNENNALTRAPRVDDACATPLIPAQVEYGREGKGIDKSIVAKAPIGNSDFAKLKQAYPKRAGNYGWKAAEKKFNSLVKTGVDPAVIIAAAVCLCQTLRSKIGTEFIPMPASWLNSEDFAESAADAFVAHVPAKGYYAAFDSPQLDAWDKHNRSLTGRLLPRDIRGGWQVDSEWPPGYTPIESLDREAPSPALRSMQ